MKTMKILSLISKIVLSSLMLTIFIVGCKDSAPLNIDPIEKDTLFTFAPSHGFPGTTVMIEGDIVTGTDRVAIGSTEAEITSSGEGVVNITVPVGAQSGKIKLVKETSVVTSLTSFKVDETPIPTILGFSPELVGSNQTVEIKGSLLDIVDSVYIGALKAEVDLKTDTALSVITPAGLQTDYIYLYYKYMTSYGVEKVGVEQSESMLALALPVISSFKREIALLNIGDTLVIYGSMFNSVTSVLFGDIVVPDTSFTIVSDSELEAVVPAGATTGKIILVVPDGQIESEGTFRINLPTLASFIPLSGDDISPQRRTFSILGTGFSLVESITMENNTATIDSRTDTHLTFNIDGGTGGFIKLHTSNGIVTSDIPFLIYGDYWIANWDDVFDPERMGRGDAFDKVNDAAITTESVNGIDGNYRKYKGTMQEGQLARIYWRDDNNLFSFYATSSKGVSIQFDMSYTSVPDGFLNEDGSMTLNFFFFTASRSPYGHSINVDVPFNGPEDWQHVVINLEEVTVDENLDNGTMEAGGAAGVIKPNDLRILCPTFPSALNAEMAGKTIEVNFDNIKFKLED